MLWDLSFSDFLILLVIFGPLSYICGWISDVLLDRVGFGPLGNSIVILLGAFTGMFVYNYQGYYLFRDSSETYFVIGFSAFTAIVMLASVKRVAFH